MKYCTKCGKELFDDAVVCVGCGCAVASHPSEVIKTVVAVTPNEPVFTTATKVFMVLGTVLAGIYILPLAWCIPMTVSYFKKVNSNQPISTGFKVCSLLFVSMIGGILMLCDKEH